MGLPARGNPPEKNEPTSSSSSLGSASSSSSSEPSSSSEASESSSSCCPLLSVGFSVTLADPISPSAENRTPSFDTSILTLSPNSFKSRMMRANSADDRLISAS